MGLKLRHILINFTLLLLLIYLPFGCASVPYTYVKNIERENTLKLRHFEEQIERGRPNRFLDGLGHYFFSIPSKIILWNWKIDNHNISEESEEALRQYIAENGLYNVKIRINQYAPGGEWSRLFRNRSVSPFWRYTLGIISNVGYMILPGRVLGGDNYNPFTNTINIYSDHKAVIIHEAGHAKDFAKRKYKGTYSFLRILPLTPLYQEAIATGDAIGYYKDKKSFRDEKDAYKVLYPAYGTYIAGEGIRWTTLPFWIELAIQACAVIPCHIVGRIKAYLVKEPIPDSP